MSGGWKESNKFRLEWRRLCHDIDKAAIRLRKKEETRCREYSPREIEAYIESGAFEELLQGDAE